MAFRHDAFSIYLHDTDNATNKPSIDEQISEMLLTRKKHMYILLIHGVQDTTSNPAKLFVCLLNQLLGVRKSHIFRDWKEIRFQGLNFEIDLKLAELIVCVANQSTKNCKKVLTNISFEGIELTKDACLYIFEWSKQRYKRRRIYFHSCKCNDMFVAGIPISLYELHGGTPVSLNSIRLKFFNSGLTIENTENFLKECQLLADNCETKLEALIFSNEENMSLEVLERLLSFIVLQLEITNSTFYCKRIDKNINFPGKLAITRNPTKCEISDITFDMETINVANAISRAFKFRCYSFQNCNVAMESLKHLFYLKSAKRGSSSANEINFHNCTLTSQTASMTITIFSDIKNMTWKMDNNEISVALSEEDLNIEPQDSIGTAMEMIVNDYFLFESVTELELSESDITDSGIQHIVRYLNQTKLKKLNLNDTELNDNHVIDLCEAIKSNTILKVLNMSNNDDITIVGLRRLLQMFTN